MFISIYNAVGLIGIGFFIACISLKAQSDAALDYIRSKTNVESLEQKAREWRVRDSLRYAEAVAKAIEKGWPIRTEDSTGVTEIAFLDENGSPVYRTTTNTNAAISTQTNLVHSGGGAGYDLNGENMTVGEWDGGGVRTTHEILNGRVYNKDGAANINHATHVAGTLIGSDAGSIGSKGMAPEAILNAYDWNSDNAEMTSEAADGLLISNHSYGLITGWRNSSQWYGNLNISDEEDYNFGRYSRSSWDDIAYNAPFYLIVMSAGNDRNDTPPSVGSTYYYWLADDTLTYDPANHPNTSPAKDGGADGYDCISFYKISKNILTVGAVDDVLNYNGPGDVDMTSFSSWGPADDGRIKP
ncbi:MAG: S8 family serine peptidase, partial [Bacteroidetes bacterium]|nr:S8 family serine peptidase [Bacteroidota bacterium]